MGIFEGFEVDLPRLLVALDRSGGSSLSGVFLVSFLLVCGEGGDSGIFRVNEISVSI